MVMTIVIMPETLPLARPAPPANPLPILGGSCVIKSRAISRVTITYNPYWGAAMPRETLMRPTVNPRPTSICKNPITPLTVL